jgi:uncharacterized protein YeaO (DUF488 family)
MDKNIYTSYFANYRKFPKDCIAFSLARILKWESPMEKLIQFAPSNDLFNAYKSGMLSEEDFKEVYLNQLNDLSEDELDEIVSKIIESPSEDVLLLCYEKKGDFCHRHILREFINNKYNLKIKEL